MTTTLVAGIFEDRDRASAALYALIEAHFDPQRDVGVIAVDDTTEQRVPVVGYTRSTEAAVVGGTLFGLLGAAAAVVAVFGGIPGIVIAGAPALAILETGVLSGGGGAIASGLFGMGVRHDEALFDATDLEQGRVWVAVRTTPARAADARAVLEDAGAERLISRTSLYAAPAWPTHAA